MAKSTIGYGSCRHADGSYGVAAIDLEQSTPLFYTPMAGRAHDLTLSPDGNHLLCMARRPGLYLSVIDAFIGEVLAQHTAAKGRHFYGHACFSADGRYLFTTESDYGEARGVIGVRDSEQGYQQVAEWDAHGIGPHQIKLSVNGKFLVVAIGGIQTHPDSGREKLNLDTMQSALVYLDANDGKLVDRYTLPESQRSLSIRHIAVTDDDLVGMAFQDQEDFNPQNPLVGFHRQGSPIQTHTASEGIQIQMHGYCASIATDSSGRWFAVTSPRGNLITLWDAEAQDKSQFCARTVRLGDCSGVAATGRTAEFIVSSGRGKMLRVDAQTGMVKLSDSRVQNQSIAWDNHLISL